MKRDSDPIEDDVFCGKVEYDIIPDSPILDLSRITIPYDIEEIIRIIAGNRNGTITLDHSPTITFEVISG